MNEKVERAYKELKEALGGAVGDALPALDGILTFFVDKQAVVQVLNFLKNHKEGAFDLLTDITAVDWLNMPGKEARFEVIYHLCSTTNNHRIRIKAKVDESDLKLPSVTGVYLAANWLEREIFDMFGIVFDGHPDLRRILTWEGFEGHPLRKDFPTRGVRPIERTPYS